ncbi:MAG: radical SAM protein, partial [Chloroflexia bacterium]
YDQEEGGSVRCRLCPWFCRLAPGETGLCRVRQNREGALYSLNYGRLAAAAVEPIERRGLYHLFPGSIILTLGSWGDNLPCGTRSVSAEMPAEDGAKRLLDPERAAAFAVEHRCRGIAWGYREPAVWLEYVLDSAKMARANGLFTCLITKGLITREALDLLGPYLDACAAELLAASGSVYERACGRDAWGEISGLPRYLRERWRAHIEIHTPLLVGINDDDEVLRGLADWILEELGPETPWHLWRKETFGLSPASMEALDRARVLGQERGLAYVYVQTGTEESLSNTRCPSCGQTLIRREGRYYIKISGIEEGRCTQCGHEIYLRRTIFK